MFGNTGGSGGFNFGQTPTTNVSTFGAQTSSFGMFGQQQQQPVTLFGTQTQQPQQQQSQQSSTLGFNFMSPTNSSSSTFGSSTFGQQSQQTTAKTQAGFMFGQATQPAFGTSTFSTQQPNQSFSTTQSSIFGQPSNNSLSGSQNVAFNSAFGAKLTPNTVSFQSTFVPSLGINSLTTQPSIFGSSISTFGTANPAVTTSQNTVFGGFGTSTATTTTSLSFPSSSSSVLSFNPSTTTTVSLNSLNASNIPATFSNFGAPITKTDPLNLSAVTANTSALTSTSSITPISAPTFGGITGSLNLGIGITTTTSTTSTAIKPLFGAATTTTVSSLSLTNALSSTTTSQVFSAPATSNALINSLKPSGFTTQNKPDLTTTLSSDSTTPQITFGKLEDQINIWMNELSQFESDFHSQSQTINSWDSLLISNGQKLIEVNQVIDKLKIAHRGLDHQLDFIIAQQKELEQLLEQIEDNKLDLNANTVNAEREHTYSLVENVHNDLNAIGSDLKDFIKKLNETKLNQDSNDPFVQISKILNSHMDVLQWIESQIKTVKVN